MSSESEQNLRTNTRNQNETKEGLSSTSRIRTNKKLYENQRELGIRRKGLWVFEAAS